MLKLYHTPLSPYCRKIRMLLKEKELEFELINENVWDRRREFFALNPAGEVPVLIDGDNTPICHSIAISEYLEEAYPEANFLGATPQDRAEVRRIVGWFDTKFYDEVTKNLLFEKIYKRLWHYGEPSSEAIRAGKQNIRYHLDYIAYLTRESQWLAGDHLTMADMPHPDGSRDGCKASRLLRRPGFLGLACLATRFFAFVQAPLRLTRNDSRGVVTPLGGIHTPC
ncbi:MAG: glutathione S-transferase family protein [Rickettsiales bacterium]